jgi:DNA polymerase-3 subunit gamma/tau
MKYQVIARKFRPQVFDEVIGQKSIVRTLQNAIQTDRVGHAYLFSGPRGVGKTTYCSHPGERLELHQRADDRALW